MTDEISIPGSNKVYDVIYGDYYYTSSNALNTTRVIAEDNPNYPIRIVAARSENYQGRSANSQVFQALSNQVISKYLYGGKMWHLPFE